MTKENWKNKITEQTIKIGTYKPEFEDVIDSLATILEQRDKAYEDFIASGGHPVISRVNRVHETNYYKNPLLVTWGDLNSQALAFWRDLGVTPAGLKKINEDLLVVKKSTSFGELLKNELSK